jgi:MerR family transcriptional regulator, repressor of the yfmOP operon
VSRADEGAGSSGAGAGRRGLSATTDHGYRIGEVAERVGVTTRTIRYYEERGLLGAADRSKGAHRLYTEADIGRLVELVRLRDLLGLSLEDLVDLADTGHARAALRDQWAESASDEERLAIVEAAIPLVQRQIELVSTRRVKLDEFAEELATKLEGLHERLRELRSETA